MLHHLLPKKSSIYVTYISNDRDYKGVLALHHNLKFKLKSRHPFGCVILEDGVSQRVKNIFEKVGILIFEFNLRKILEEQYSFKSQETIDHIIQKHYYGKFLIHQLDPSLYDKIIYLDTDLLILKEIDFLFERIEVQKEDEIHMTYDLSQRWDETIVFKEDRFNSGVILCVPNSKITDFCFETIRDYFCASQNPEEISKMLFTDQTVYDYLNGKDEKGFNVCHLEYRFNCVSGISKGLAEKGILNEDDVYVVHFILKPKPWDLIDFSDDVVNTFLYSDSEKYFVLWQENYFEMVKNLTTKIFSKNIFRNYENKKFILWNERENNEILLTSVGAETLF